MTFHEFDEHDDAIRSTLAELTRRFALGTPIEDTLAGVTAAAVDLIRAADCADVLVIEDGDFQSLASTSLLAETRLSKRSPRKSSRGPGADPANRDDRLSFAGRTGWPCQHDEQTRGMSAVDKRMGRRGCKRIARGHGLL